MSNPHRSLKVHRDPPDRPEPALVDDGYYVLPEEVEPRAPFTGWESMRHRWDESGNDPISHRTALIGAVICAVVIAIIVLLAAASRPATSTVIPAAGSVPLASGNLSSSQTGAPHPLGSQSSDGRRYWHAAGRSGALSPRAEWPVPALLGAPPSGGASSSYQAQATYCAPTVIDGVAYCTDWGGDAHLAAVFGFRDGHAPYWVRVTRGDRHTDVLVVSYCACHGRHDRIDLSPASFRELAPLRLGRIAVTVENLNWPYEPGGDPPPHPDDERMRLEDRELPATDTAL